MKGLDLSFDAQKVTPEWAQARRREGWELLIVNLWTGRSTPDGAQGALRTWREAGGLTAAYVVVHDGMTAQMCIARARAAAGSEWERLAFVAVDVELDPVTVETVAAACALIEQSGQRPCVYTARWFWHGRLGDPHDLADTGRPLWDASYNVPPSLGAPGYGGWLARVGHQYRGTTLCDGIAVDLNLFDGEWVRAGVQRSPSPEEEWQNVLDVVRGWSQQLAQASRELEDVADIIERLRAGVE